MKLSIDKAIYKEFPEAKIGWLLADVDVKDSDSYVDGFKKTLEHRMNDIGISADTMMQHPDVSGWRDVYGKMGVKPSKYRCSLESLLRRIFKGMLWDVSNVVDLYDCVSALNLLPMGSHDVTKLKGDLTLRYGREGEKFYPLGAGDEVIDVDPRNIVYADDEKVCCWLWNYRDTRDASVSEETKQALFLVDQAFDTEWRSVEQGLDALAEELEKIGAKVLKKGIVSQTKPVAEI